MKKPQNVTSFDLEPLEPRILLSSDGAELLAPIAAEVVQESSQDPSPTSTIPLQGDGLYTDLFASSIVVDSSGVWGENGQKLAESLAGLHLTADSVVIADGVSAGDFRLDAGSINLGAVQWSGATQLYTDSLSLADGQSAASDAVLSLAPLQRDASISLGFDGPGFSLSSDALASLSAAGLSELVIGHADGSHVFTIDGLAYNGNLTLRAPADGGQFNVNSTITHSGGALTYIGSGHTQNASADTITSGVPIQVLDSLNLVSDDLVTKTYGPNTILLDTTNNGGTPGGANILITGDILGTGVGEGGVLYLNAGTNGDILIQGNVGTTDPLDGIVILNARNVTFQGNILLNFLTQQAGTGDTTFGDAATDTLEIDVGDLTVTTTNNITFNGDVTVNEGDILLASSTASAGTAKIHFKEEVTVLDGNLTITSAKSVEFTKAVDVSGTLSQITGTQTTIFRADVDAGVITLRANLEIRFNAQVRLATGDITLVSNDVNFNGGAASVIGASDVSGDPLSDLLIQAIDPSVSMDIGALGGTGTMKFTTTDIAALDDGFISLTFGYASGATNAVRVSTATFLDATTIHGGSILVNGALNAQESLLLHAATGDIEFSGAQARVSNDQVDSVWGSSLLTVTADQGDILLTSGGSLRILNDDDTDLTQGSAIVLTATNGDILNAVGSFGFVTARDLTATAAGDITLLTDIANLTAASTVAGAIQIDEQDELHVVSVTTANGPVTLITGGDTTVDLIESLTDHADNDISVQVFNGDLLVTRVLAGTLGDVTLETEGALTGFSPQAIAHVTAHLLSISSANGIGTGVVPLLLLANTLAATNTTSGAVVLRQLDGRASLEATLDHDGDGHVSLTVLGTTTTTIGSAGFLSAASAGIRVDAASDLTVNGDLLGSGGPLTILSGGNVVLASGVSVGSGGGDVFLSATGDLTQAADSSLSSSGGNISFDVDGNGVLGLLDAQNPATPSDPLTRGHIALLFGGDIQDTPASSALNLRANTLQLRATTGIGDLDGTTELGLEIDAVLLAALNTTSGDIALKDANALGVGSVASFTPVLLLEDGGTTDGTATAALADVTNSGGGDILVSAVGNLTLSSSGDAVSTSAAGHIALLGAAVTLTGTVRSAGGDLSLDASGAIDLSTPGSLITSGTGTIAVRSTGGGFNAAATSQLLTGSGDIVVSVTDDLLLGTVSTTGDVGLSTSAGLLAAATGGTDTRTVVTAASLTLHAENGVNGPSGSGEAFRTNVDTLSLSGGDGPEFQIHNDGTLTLTSTTATATLYSSILASANLQLGPQSNVDVTGEGNIGIVFDAGDGILAAGNLVRTTGAGTIVLTAGGAFTMQAASLVTNENGDIHISAQNNVAIASVTSTDGDISVTSATGAIFDNDPAEAAIDFSTDGQLDLTAATGIGINAGDRQTFDVLLGTLSAETATGGIFVRSTASFATNGLLSTDGTTPISVTSDGDLTVGPNGSGIAVDSTGDVVLLAGGALTQLTGSTIESLTDIRLGAVTTLTLVEVSTPGDVALSAATVTGLSASTTTEVSANGLFLDNVGTVGTPSQPLHVAVSRLAGTVTAGTLAFANNGNLALGLVTVSTTPITPMGALPGLTHIQTGDRLVVNGAGLGLFADITGSLTADAGSGHVLTVAETIPVLWQTSTSQTWNDSFSLGGGLLTLRAGSDITLNGLSASSTGGGATHIEAGGDFTHTFGSSLDLGAGSLVLESGDSALLDGAISSTASIAVLAAREIIVGTVGGPTRLTAQNLILRASYRIANGLLSLTTDVSAIAALSGAGGIYVTNAGDVTVTNLGFSVPSLLPGAIIHTAFSGFLGGLTTTQAGPILLNTTGTLTVLEVSSVLNAFPGTPNAISLRADNPGPDGNAFNIVFDVIRSGLDGDPVTTTFTAEDSLLTVTLREGVSTLQDILDAINAAVDFPFTAVLAEGLVDASQVFTLDPAAETQFFAEGGRREGVLASVSATFSGGAEPISAISQIVLPGEFYTILLTALNPGADANAFVVRVLDDGPGGRLPDAADEAEVVWDDLNGVLSLFINFGTTTVGTLLDAITDANTTDGVPFSAELNGFFVPSDLDDVLGAAPVLLQSNLSPTATFRPTGTHNDFEAVAVIGGSLYNGVRFEFVDDGSVPTLGVRASFNNITNLMTVYIQSNVTTANQIIAAIDAQGEFTGALVQELSGGVNSGLGTVQAHRFVLSGGAVGVKASTTLAMSGSDNDIFIEAAFFGADQNGIQVVLLRDDTQLVGQATASWNSLTRVLEVRLNPDFATAGNVRNAIAAVVSAPLVASLVPGNSGFGGIILSNYPLTSGGTDGPARADFIAVGDHKDFELVAEAENPNYENIQAFLIDDGSITDGSASVQFFAIDKRLILRVQSGVTTLNTLLSVLNADVGVPVNGNLLPGNDGTGVFNIPQQPFLGGVDPVKALASTVLPSGVTLTLEADNGGIAPNGIEVVYAIDNSLAPGTAAATLFEVDDVRLLQIRVYNSLVTFNTIDAALTTAGLPFSVLNLGTIGALPIGTLPVRSPGTNEGSVRLLAEGNVSLIGRVQSQTGPVNITTTTTGDLTFDSETSRIYALSGVDIQLAGSFANISSLESPLIKVYSDGLLRILAGSQATPSLEPVLLLSGGDITIGGLGGMALDNENLTALADGTITISGPIDAGTGNVVFDAGETLVVTSTGSASGTDLTLTAETGVTQNGNLTAIGAGVILVSTTAGDILMGADAVTQSDTGDITYNAPGNIGVTAILSTSGDLTLTSGGAILDTHAANGLNLATSGFTTLTAQTGIGAILTGDLKTNLAQVQIRNLGASGDIVITETAAGGDLTVTELTQNADNGWSILTVQGGNLTFSGTVTHTGTGNLLVGVTGNLLFQETVTLAGGIITLGATGNVTFDKNVSSGGGDVSVISGGVIDMDSLMTLDADGGNVLLQATGNVLLAQIHSPDADVRIESTAASILRAANDGRTNVIAGILQLDAALAVASLASEAAALITDVTRLTSTSLNGVFALRELNDLVIGASTVQLNFAQIDRTLLPGSWSETQLLTGSGAAVLRVDGSLTVETIAVNPTLSINGNFRVIAGGGITLDGDTDVTGGSAHLSSTLDFAVNGDIDVSGGTLLLDSAAALTQGSASVLTVDNANAVLSAGGVLTVSRVDTGTGSLALTAGDDILRDAAAPAVQLSASGLRLASGGAIGTVALPIDFSAATLAAQAVDGIHLHSAGDVDVNTLAVTVNTLTTLGVLGTARTEVALADLTSTAGGNILLTVDGLLELNDGDDDDLAVSTLAGGHIVLHATTLDAYADVSAVLGHISLAITGAAHFVTTPAESLAAKLLTQDGDIHVVVGAALTMDDETAFVTDNGNAYVQTTGNLLVASIRAPNGLLALDVGAALLDNGDSDTDLVADELQILAATGIGLLSPYNAIDIDTNRLAARATSGPFALAELTASTVGAVEGSVLSVGTDLLPDTTTVSRLFGLANLGGGSLSMTAVGSLTFETSGDTADADHAVRVTSAGHIVVQTTGAASLLTVNDSVLAGTGHITLRGFGGIVLGDDVPVTTTGTGTITVLSSTGGITQNAGGTLDAESDIVLNASGSVAVAGILTDTRVAITAGGAITDNEALRVNITAASLRLHAGLNIADGTNALDTSVDTLSARTLNGAMFLQEVDGLDIAATSAETQVVGVNAALTPTPVASQTGLITGGTAGTIVVTTLAGALHVTSGNIVSASQAGNILLTAPGNLTIDAAVSSGSGSITLETQADFALAGGILVSTGGAGQIHVFSGGLITTGAESRFVANIGNVVINAVGNILLGGIYTLGRAAIGSANGYIRGAGSTGFDQEVVAEQLLLSAVNAGVGTLSPASPVSPFRTRIGRLAGEAGPDGLNIVNEISFSVDLVTITVQRVIASGSLQILPTLTLEDVVTLSGDGSIVLRATGGSVTLNEGGDLDGNAVVAHGSGNIRVFGSVNVTANADVRSSTGHITLRAAGAIYFGDDADVITSAPGTVYLRAETGVIDMSATTAVNADAILVVGSGNVVVGALTATDIGVRSTNGSITRADGSVLNFSGTNLRLESSSDIGAPDDPLTTDASALSARSTGGGIYLSENDSITIGSTSVTVEEVLNDASTQPVSDADQVGLVTTANNGPIVLLSGGDITVDGLVSAHGSGNMLLEATTLLDINANVSSATGNISLVSGTGLDIANTLSVSTASPGSILLEGGTGGVTLYAATVISAPGGSLRVRANGDVSVGLLSAVNVSLISSGGSILNVSGAATNVTASNLRLSAAVAVASAGTHLRTSVSTLAASAGAGGIFLTEANAVIVGSVAVITPLVQANASTQDVTDEALPDLTTTANGNIVLVTLAGSITLNDGDENFNAVSAGGSGSVRIDAAGDLIVNAGATSDTGHITLRAGQSVSFGVGVVAVTTASPGSVSIHAAAGSVPMTGLTTVTSTGGSLRVRAQADITLGNLSASNVSVLSSAGSILNAVGTTRNVISQNLRLEAQVAAGTAARRLTIATDTLTALTRGGGVYLSELNAITVGSVAVTVTEYNANGSTSDVTDASQSNISTSNTGDVVIVTGGTLTVGGISGLTVNVLSSGAIVNNALVAPAITATHLLLNAQDDIGSAVTPLTFAASVLSAHSVAGNIYLSGTGNTTVGTVLNLSTPNDLLDSQAGVRSLANLLTSLAVSGNLTLGLVTGGTVALVSGGQVLVTLGSTLNVESTNLRIQAATGIGEIGRYLNIRVATLAAFSLNGDILLSETNAVTIGSVSATVAGLTPETLSGLVTQNGGDIVLLAGPITVTDPVTAAGNVRLSAAGALLLGTVTGVDVSLLSTAAITHPSGLVTATHLRVNATGNITILTQADVLSAVSNTGSLTLTETDNVALGSVAVTAGGVTDAAQHGLSAPLGITATSLAGTFLDGGDALADVRSDGPVSLTTAGGLAATGSGALEVDAASLTLTTNGVGSVYLNLIGDTSLPGITLGGSGHLYLNVAGTLTLTDTITLPNGGAFLTITGDALLNADILASRDIRVVATNIAIDATLQSATLGLDLRASADFTMTAGALLDAARDVRLSVGGNAVLGLVSALRNADIRITGDLSAIATNRADHEITAPTVLLQAGGTINPLLTDAGRLDVQAGGSVVITELDNLEIGRYGLRSINATPADTFQLNLGSATLSSVTGTGIVDNAGEFAVDSSGTVVLDTRLRNDTGDITLNTGNLTVAVAGTDPMLDADLGRVTLVNDGTITGPLVVRADEFTASSQTGGLDLTFTEQVRIVGEGITLALGTGDIDINVLTGDLVLEGRIRNLGSWNVDINVLLGKIHLRGDLISNASTTAILRAGNQVNLTLDTGLTLVGVTRMLMLANTSHSVITRTGSLFLQLQTSAANAQVNFRNFLISEGTGSMDLFIGNGQNAVLLGGFSIRNLATTGGLTLKSTGFLSMSAGTTIRNNAGAMILEARDFEIAQIISLGTSTRLTVTSTLGGLGFRPKDGTPTGFIQADHNILFQLYSLQKIANIQLQGGAGATVENLTTLGVTNYGANSLINVTL